MTASDAREKLYRLIDQVDEEHKPIVITGKRKNAVLVSEEDWNSIQETLYLISIPGFVDSVKEAAKEPIEDCVSVEELDW
jgi:prevent-host-death family protein